MLIPSERQLRNLLVLMCVEPPWEVSQAPQKQVNNLLINHLQALL